MDLFKNITLYILFCGIIVAQNSFEDFKKKALDFSRKKFFDNETLFKEINLVLY